METPVSHLEQLVYRNMVTPGEQPVYGVTNLDMASGADQLHDWQPSTSADSAFHDDYDCLSQGE